MASLAGSLRYVCLLLTSCATVACGESATKTARDSRADGGSATYDGGTSPGDGDSGLDAQIPGGDGGAPTADDAGLDGSALDDGSTPASDAGDAGDASESSTNSFAMGETTFTQTPSEQASSGFDPMLSVDHRRSEFRPYGLVTVQSAWADGQGYRDLAYVRLYTEGGPTLSGSYSIAGGDAPGHAEFFARRQSLGASEYQCDAVAGTVSISDGGPGHKTVGTFTVTAWSAYKGTCPATPTTGSFELAHGADDLAGNSGTQGDWFTVDGVTHTEGDTILYTPRVYARHYGSNDTLIVSMVAGLELVEDNEDDWRQLELYVYGSGDTAGGTYPTGTGALITYQTRNVTCLAPVTGNGSVELAPYGDVGSVITGTITINNWNSGTGCPDTPWTVPFSATREADD